MTPNILHLNWDGNSPMVPMHNILKDSPTENRYQQIKRIFATVSSFKQFESKLEERFKSILVKQKKNREKVEKILLSILYHYFERDSFIHFMGSILLDDYRYLDESIKKGTGYSRFCTLCLQQPFEPEKSNRRLVPQNSSDLLAFKFFCEILFQLLQPFPKNSFRIRIYHRKFIDINQVLKPTRFYLKELILETKILLNEFDDGYDQGKAYLKDHDISSNLLQLIENVDNYYDKNTKVSNSSETYKDWIGQSDSIEVVKLAIEYRKKDRDPILILGESGTGKEFVAKAIASVLGKELYTVNCSTLSKELARSELFGHKKGSFTGADRDQTGIFENADGGVVFLDEVHHLDSSIQGFLLRFLEDGIIDKLGHRGAPIKPIVRVVVATNKSLPELKEKKILPTDLLDRFGLGKAIQVPSLRQRGIDHYRFIKYFTYKHKFNPSPILYALFSTLIQKEHHNIRYLADRIDQLCMEKSIGISNNKKKTEIELFKDVFREEINAFHQRIDNPIPRRSEENNSSKTIVIKKEIDHPRITISHLQRYDIYDSKLPCAWDILLAKKVIDEPNSFPKPVGRPIEFDLEQSIQSLKTLIECDISFDLAASKLDCDKKTVKNRILKHKQEILELLQNFL